MMSDMTLVISNKNYCLWPLSAWLCMKFADLKFEEIVIPFEQPNTTERMLEYGPTGRVPVLKHGSRTIWDSLAICEYINELVPEAKLWPAETEARSVARSVASEMHSGGGRAISFTFDTNIRRRTKQITPTQDVNKNIERILEIWRDCRTRFGGDGPFLFGKFTIADAMQAHIVNRFVTYDIELPAEGRKYLDTIRNFPPLVEWIKAAELEPWKMERVDKLFSEQE